MSTRPKGALMIQGTTSDAGKSTLVAALCRALKRKGVSVAPFKPQNMALNSAVTPDGGEIGRAQALQAAACGLEPDTLFNPVLLKPSSDQRSQVIVRGKAIDDLEAKQFGSIKELAFDSVLEAYHTLREQYDVVLIEGAGSPAEINLRDRDIANMGFAEAVDCPVVLIADIDKGGVFAHLVGTLNLLSESEQARTKGFVINRFRGSLDLLQSGLDWLENHTQKTVLGVLPYLKHLKLDAEDAISHDPSENNADGIRIKVPVFARISNHTDFDPIANHPKINFSFVGPGESLSGADLIILPGSKNVRAEMAYLEQYGWDKEIKQHLRYGGKVLGICGGFQLLGTSIHDPEGIEDIAGTTDTLNLLDFETTLHAEKQLKQVTGTIELLHQKASINGYEIHCGTSAGPALNNHFCVLSDQQSQQYSDGCLSEDGQLIGTYVHGLFEDKNTTQLLLEWVTSEKIETTDWADIREHEINRIADVVEANLDIEKIISCIS